MLRICIPVHNEAATIGVLLWRLRSVFQGFSREYDVVVYDDASTDGTADVLEPYQSVMPLTVLRGATHVGYANSIDALVRHVAADDEYARRDAMVLLQGDFTESPEHLPELVKRFEGGADLVAVERSISDATPADERRLRRWGRWAVKPFLRLPAIADPFTGFRLVRISVLRDLLKVLGNRPVCAGQGWAANIDFALNVAPFARRIENVEFAPRYDVRQRASRRRGWPDVVALFHWARSARHSVRPIPGGKPGSEQSVRGEQALVLPVPAERLTRAPDPEPRDRSDRGRRASRDAADNRTSPPSRDARPPRDARAEREERPARDAVKEARPPREGRNAREERALRGEERTTPTERPPREPKEARELTESREPREPHGAREPRAPRAPRPPRAERVARDVTPSAVNPDTPADLEPLRHLEPSGSADLESLDDTEGAEEPALDPVGGATAGERAGEKKRRRRRRSRRDRGERVPGSSAEGGDVDADSGDASDGNGTSEPAEGEQGDDREDPDGAEQGDAGTEVSADGTRRKRRPRRRRRGRRPGAAESGAPDESTPPAAEPPAA